MANYQELANLVWNVADDVLRGLFKQHEYGDITSQILILLCGGQKRTQQRDIVRAQNYWKKIRSSGDEHGNHT